MKRLVLRLAVTIITFAIGVGVGRLVSTRQVGHWHQRLGPVTANLVVPHREPSATTTPYPIPRPNLIFDYDKIKGRAKGL